MPRKRAPNGSGVVRQRKDGRWEGVFSAGVDPGTGRLIRRSVYGKSEAEVAKALRKATAAVDDGAYVEPSKLTVGQWLNIWLDEYCGNLKMYSIRNYRSQVKNHILPSLNVVKLKALSPHMVQKMYNKLQSEDGLSSKTLANIHGILHRAMAQAVALGYVKVNPTSACTLPRVVRKEIAPLDDGQIRAFLEAIKGHQHENLFIVDLFTGLRQGEVLGLTWDNIDFERGMIGVEKQLYRPRKGGTYTFETLKNDKKRTLSPAPFVMQTLRDERRKQLEARVQAGAAWNEGQLKGLVFTSSTGGHLVHGTVYRSYKRLVIEAGIPEARFHDLRHSYAVAALRSGDDVKTVQEALGHHTAAFTLDQYGHVTEAMKQASAQRMEAYISSLNRND